MGAKPSPKRLGLGAKSPYLRCFCAYIGGCRGISVPFILPTQNPSQGANIESKLDTIEINERTFILLICGFHTLTVYGLLLTKKIKVSCGKEILSQLELGQPSPKMSVYIPFSL